MIAGRQMAKAGLFVSWDIEEPHTGTCGCKICCRTTEVIYNKNELMRSEIMAEAKSRKCVRKSCRKSGCDCT
jgi:hypothetical protein